MELEHEEVYAKEQREKLTLEAQMMAANEEIEVLCLALAEANNTTAVSDAELERVRGELASALEDMEIAVATAEAMATVKAEEAEASAQAELERVRGELASALEERQAAVAKAEAEAMATVKAEDALADIQRREDALQLRVGLACMMLCAGQIRQRVLAELDPSGKYRNEVDEFGVRLEPSARGEELEQF